ncbi:peptide-methionine (S)-S-oxide reductase MsrA [Desulfovibrio ferrophilus]|uniref:Peptide methionine sulfoxide reductase MsrA n=1 Tax=Desulfovibrio ferrophilus TaxID=241368 RepID=A0A2Z6B229_9BACT|nr:peptide-methionine (S)-S-oxide reductase MsrA [Desulfovibrio ferrophilus]BBD09531.1 peptide methionine sulfoxide reductase [Desulfovibrio ferrophilus]
MKILLFLIGGLLAMTTTAYTQTNTPDATPARAIFAGGCFWCMEHPFDELDGVASTTPGYIGGETTNPTYQEVSSGGTGHTEAMLVEYDPAKVSYETLLTVFWKNIDPTDAGGQFCDRGSQYRSGIFPLDDEQMRLAQASKVALGETGKLPGKVVTEVTLAGPFWPAEEYHHDYYKRNPIRYKYYRFGCGRDKRLKELWGAE